ncbi:MAG: alpha/beta fold hydrolase [Archangium sp.]|nr:alpha/beta fold hydrolase [Archangium sp.]
MPNRIAARPVAPGPSRAVGPAPKKPQAKAATATSSGWRAAASKLGLTAYGPLKAPPVLKRPVVMIPGLTMPAASFDPLAKQLTSIKANGAVATYVAADGRFHLGGKNGPVMRDADVATAKVFQLEYRDAKGPTTDKAPQIAALLREVKRVTGSKDIDVVSHSAGGTDFRHYLDTRTGADRNVPIHSVVMIGPVSHGTAMGNIGAVAGGVLKLKEASKQLGIGDPLVKHLDATWDTQRKQIAKDVTIIAISGAPTLGPNGSVKPGDGYVQVEEIDLPKAKTVVLRGADPTPIAHLKEVGYTGVINEVGAALGRD